MDRDYPIEEYKLLGFPGCSDGQESACSVRDLGLSSGSGRSLGEGNSNPPQYSRLENSMDRGAWWATLLAEGRYVFAMQEEE